MFEKRKRVIGQMAGGGVVHLLALCLLSSVLCLLNAGCGIYSFTGASIPEHLRTVAVPLAEVRARGAAVDLDRQLTDALIERFADRTRLSLEPNEDEADAVLQATIQRYSITPVAVTGDEVASLNRVTLVVDILYRDRVQDEDRLSRSFTASADYDPAEGATGEAEAATLALEQIVGDVFTATTSNW
jgi:hypothetical protein